MQKPYPVPENEQKRLEALRKYQILDTAPESDYDHITALAAMLLDCPMAFISFIDEDRQWFKSKVGLDVCETGRDVAFCAHTIMSDEVLVVEDAKAHPIFKENPLVTGDPKIRFYAGAPIRNADGVGLGSVCIVDLEPKQITDKEIAALKHLAALTMKLLNTRKILDDLVAVGQELKVLQGMLPICANCKCIRTNEGEWQRLERYMMAHSEASFSHGICPECREKLYPGF